MHGGGVATPPHASSSKPAWSQWALPSKKEHALPELDETREWVVAVAGTLTAGSSLANQLLMGSGGEAVVFCLLSFCLTLRGRELVDQIRSDQTKEDRKAIYFVSTGQKALLGDIYPKSAASVILPFRELSGMAARDKSAELTQSSTVQSNINQF